MKQCDGYPNQECQGEAENHIFGYDLCGACAKNYVSECEDELRKELAKVRHAALAAYHILSSDVDGYDADSDPPPNELLNTHALLFEALELHKDQSEDNSADLPF